MAPQRLAPVVKTAHDGRFAPEHFLSTLAAHFEDLRRALQRSVEAYNSAVGSFESRVLVGARRFKELGASSGPDIEPPRVIESAPRALQAPEEQTALPLPAATGKA